MEMIICLAGSGVLFCLIGIWYAVSGECRVVVCDMCRVVREAFKAAWLESKRFEEFARAIPGHGRACRNCGGQGVAKGKGSCLVMVLLFVWMVGNVGAGMMLLPLVPVIGFVFMMMGILPSFGYLCANFGTEYICLQCGNKMK
jgi:hypothetical protein